MLKRDDAEADTRSGLERNENIEVALGRGVTVGEAPEQFETCDIMLHADLGKPFRVDIEFVDSHQDHRGFEARSDRGPDPATLFTENRERES